MLNKTSGQAKISTMRSIKRKIKKLDFTTLLLVIILIAINLGFAALSTHQKSEQKAKVVSVEKEYNDGGIIYQELLVNDGNKDINVKQEIPDEHARYKVSDTVVIDQQKDTYKIKGRDYSNFYLISLALLIAVLVIAIGLDDFKEMLPVISILTFLGSGMLLNVLDNHGPLLTALLFLPIITIISNLAVSRNKRVIIANTLSVLVSLMVITAFSAALFEILNLSVYYQESAFLKTNISYDSFKSLYYLSAIFISFGTVINSSISATKRAIAIKRYKYTAAMMMKKIIIESQKDIARRINVIFYIFLGMSIISMTYSYSKNENYMNNILVLANFVYFIISALGVILSVVSQAILTSLAFKEEEKLIKLNIGKKENG